MQDRNRLFAIVAYAALIVGLFSAIGGVFGVVYTYRQAAVENITTPEDARIPERPVRGPLTLWAQSDIIARHQLERTEGLRYAEMPREVPATDENGDPVLDESGEQMMVPNQARLSWVTATSLITVLGLGIVSYAFSVFAFVVGLVMIGLGLVVRQLATVREYGTVRA